MDYYDDFYGDYSYMDEKVEEFKEELKKGLKTEIQDKIKVLEKENEELQEIKKNWNNLVREYELKEKQLKIEVNNAVKDAKKLPIQELFKDYEEEYFTVAKEWVKAPKCDKCNDDRSMVLVDGYNREHKVSCPCNKTELGKYVVSSKYITKISCISKRDNKLLIWVHLSYNKPSYSYEDGYYGGSEVLNGLVVENIEQIPSGEEKQWLFTTKDEAQKYANKLNTEKLGG